MSATKLGKPVFLLVGNPMVNCPLKDKDLWGGSWRVSNHLIVADNYWSDLVYFKVEPHQNVGFKSTGLAPISSMQLQASDGNSAVPKSNFKKQPVSAKQVQQLRSRQVSNRPNIISPPENQQITQPGMVFVSARVGSIDVELE